MSPRPGAGLAGPGPGLELLENILTTPVMTSLLYTFNNSWSQQTTKYQEFVQFSKVTQHHSWPKLQEREIIQLKQFSILTRPQCLESKFRQEIKMVRPFNRSISQMNVTVNIQIYWNGQLLWFQPKSRDEWSHSFCNYLQRLITRIKYLWLSKLNIETTAERLIS